MAPNETCCVFNQKLIKIYCCLVLKGNNASVCSEVNFNELTWFFSCFGKIITLQFFFFFPEASSLWCSCCVQPARLSTGSRLAVAACRSALPINCTTFHKFIPGAELHATISTQWPRCPHASQCPIKFMHYKTALTAKLFNWDITPQIKI